MGFWFEEQKKTAPAAAAGKRPGAPARTSELKLAAAKGCAACPLDKAVGLHTPKMLPTGTTRPLIYVLGDNPNKEADLDGEQVGGKDGDFLRRFIPSSYLRGDSMRWNNTIRCRPVDPTSPQKGRAPLPVEIACCSGLQVRDIEQTRPKIIIGLGDVPLSWVTGRSGYKMSAWRGRRIAVRIGSHECWYYISYHPSAITRLNGQRRQEDLVHVFRADIKRALADAEDPNLAPPMVENPAQYYEGIEVLDKPDIGKLAMWFEESHTWPDQGFDIETNGLRPYFPDRKILSVSLSNYETTYVFPYKYAGFWSPDEQKMLKKMMTNYLVRSGRKWCHNEKFEYEWLADEFGEGVLWDGKYGCTMAQAYVLDEREGAKGLGDLTTIHFGFDVKALSHVNVKDMEGKQTLMSDDLGQKLKYNGLDAKYTFPLHLIQGDEIARQGLERVYEDQHRRALPIAVAQRRGMTPDTVAAGGLSRELGDKMKELEASLQKNKDVVAFASKHGPFDPASNPVVLKFFRDYMGYKRQCNKEQDEEKPPKWSVDEGVLALIRHPVARTMLEVRRLSKNKGTYVDPLCSGGKQIHADGLVHTNFNHCLTATRRLSSDEPNLQNFPKRKDKHIRVVIKAPAGYHMVSFDYGQIEFRVMGMASRDKTLVRMIWEDYDVHMEWAQRLIARRPHIRQVMIDDFGQPSDDDKKLMKALRNEVKNRWVFPLFFGSMQGSVEADMWCEKGDLKDDYNEFWRIFGGMKNWQEQTIKDRDRLGYVQTLTGFRRHAPVEYNEAINMPIQGTASDIVVDGMCRLSEMAYRTGRDELQFRLNLHDDLTFYLPQQDTKLEDAIEVIGKEMCRVPFDFVCTPIIVETSIGSNWYAQEDLIKFDSRHYGFHQRPAFAH